MIRVLYRFKVKEGQEKIFEDAWREITEVIKGKSGGTHGSVLVRGTEDRQLYCGVARWDTIDAWHQMRQSDVPNLEETERLMSAAQLLSMEITEEVMNIDF